MYASGDVHGDPDGTLAQVAGVNGFGADVAIDGSAVFLAQQHFSMKCLTGRKGCIALLSGVLPVLVVQVPLA